MFGLEWRSGVCDQLATIGVVYGSFLHYSRRPTVAIRLNGDHYIGRPVTDILHFHLYSGFKFSGCFARLFHGAGLAAVRKHWLHRSTGANQIAAPIIFFPCSNRKLKMIRKILEATFPYAAS